jgi:hypothetical protein
MAERIFKAQPQKQQKGSNRMGHKFLIAAYCCTWTIQLGYLLLLAVKWQRQRSQIPKANSTSRR